jgi:hypothetical protein
VNNQPPDPPAPDADRSSQHGVHGSDPSAGVPGESSDSGVAPRRAIREFLDNSSLGSSGARALKARTTTRDAQLALELSDIEVRLKNRRAHHRDLRSSASVDEIRISGSEQGMEDDLVPDLWRMGKIYAELGMPGDAQRCFLTVAEHALGTCARQSELLGEDQAASTWRARAQTLNEAAHQARREP